MGENRPANGRDTRRPAGGDVRPANGRQTWRAAGGNARPAVGVKVRATAGAVLVVAFALVVAAAGLVFMVRGSLRDGLEAQAEQRAAALAAQISATGLPADGSGDGPGDGSGADDDDDEPEDVVWQVIDDSGAVVRASRPLRRVLPGRDTGRVDLPGADHAYLVAAARAPGHTVAVGVSLEDVDNSTEALATPLLVGLPLLLLLVGGVTWTVVARALAPIERIRREAEEITGDRLDRRVPEPAARDEVHRMARTMNRMLARLQASRDRQQQFVADASHELRSPLTSMRQAAEVARAHPGALPDGELAETVLEESARMQRLVEQLLLLTRAGEGAVARTREEVDLDDLVLAEAARLRRSGVTVDTSGVGAARVRADPAAVAQVIRNLADNAARHAAGTVTMAAGPGDGPAGERPGDGRPGEGSAGERPGGGRRGEGVWLTVEDDGHGIPADQRERVFDRFVRLDEARARDDGGSGLGLAIVAEVVRAHAGSVTVSDSALGGARFLVRLPG